MQTNSPKLILNGGEYYKNSYIDRESLKRYLDNNDVELIDFGSHNLGNTSLGGADRVLLQAQEDHNFLTEENLSTFQGLYDTCKIHQELLNIFKLKIFDYLAQVKKIRESLPAVIGSLEAIANGSEIHSLKQAVAVALTKLKTILKPFLPQATTPPA